MTHIENRLPLISFKAGNGVFEDEDPLTIQQFPYAELYSNNDDNKVNDIPEEVHDLQHADDQEEDITSINTLRAQPMDNTTGDNGDEIKAMLKDSNKDENDIDESTVHNN